MIEHNFSGNEKCVLVSDTKTRKEVIFNCSLKQYQKGISNYKNGALIQDAFPFLSAGEREFLMSGLLEKEFDDLFENV